MTVIGEVFQSLQYSLLSILSRRLVPFLCVLAFTFILVKCTSNSATGSYGAHYHNIMRKLGNSNCVINRQSHTFSSIYTE